MQHFLGYQIKMNWTEPRLQTGWLQRPVYKPVSLTISSQHICMLVALNTTNYVRLNLEESSSIRSISAGDAIMM